VFFHVAFKVTDPHAAITKTAMTSFARTREKRVRPGQTSSRVACMLLFLGAGRRRTAAGAGGLGWWWVAGEGQVVGRFAETNLACFP
jgi:hypothetical protein